MRKYILIITTVASVLFIQSCYTATKQTYIKNKNSHSKSQFPQNSTLNNKLIGVWINKKLLYDYGYQIRKLKIKNNGYVIYIPASERSNNEIYHGHYRVLSDTLIIKFNEKKRTEWMKYKLKTNTLVITSLKGREGSSTNLINNCYNCFISWEKIQ